MSRRNEHWRIEQHGTPMVARLTRQIFEIADELDHRHCDTADLIGVTRNAVSQWRRGQRIPSLENLIALGYALERRLGCLDTQILCEPSLPETWEEWIYRELIAQLRDHRICYGLTQEAAAGAIGISVGSLVRHENCQIRPRPAGLMIWAVTVYARVGWIPMPHGSS